MFTLHICIFVPRKFLISNKKRHHVFISLRIKIVSQHVPIDPIGSWRFIRAIMSSARSSPLMVRSTVGSGHSLGVLGGLPVILEGVFVRGGEGEFNYCSGLQRQCLLQ